jgi:hypothetical protein
MNNLPKIDIPTVFRTEKVNKKYVEKDFRKPKTSVPNLLTVELSSSEFKHHTDDKHFDCSKLEIKM